MRRIGRARRRVQLNPARDVERLGQPRGEQLQAMADQGLITLPARKGPMPVPRWRPLKVKGKPALSPGPSSTTAKIARSAVAWAYFDTSALIKRYVDEAGRRDVLRRLRRRDVVTSAILPIDLRSALRLGDADHAYRIMSSSPGVR